MVDPRPDISDVDGMESAMWVEHIWYLLQGDKDDLALAEDLRSVDQSLREDPAMYTVVFDQLSELKIITKAQFRAWLNLRDPRDSQ